MSGPAVNGPCAGGVDKGYGRDRDWLIVAPQDLAHVVLGLGGHVRHAMLRHVARSPVVRGQGVRVVAAETVKVLAHGLGGGGDRLVRVQRVNAQALGRGRHELADAGGAGPSIDDVRVQPRFPPPIDA